jgi:hypothetical protein
LGESEGSSYQFSVISFRFKERRRGRERLTQRAQRTQSSQRRERQRLHHRGRRENGDSETRTKNAHHREHKEHRERRTRGKAAEGSLDYAA